MIKVGDVMGQSFINSGYPTRGNEIILTEEDVDMIKQTEDAIG